MKPLATNKQFLNLYFQVHQPRRLKSFRFFDVGMDLPYFDDVRNREIVRRIANECYLPANKMLLGLMKAFPAFKVTFSISGIALEQFEAYAPEVIQSFRTLAATGQVEFLGETYYHSLAYFISEQEFIDQVKMHREKLYQTLRVYPTVFRNTELIYADGIGKTVASLGFRGAYIDGVDTILKGNSPNNLYHHPTESLVLLPRNYRLSDDVAFRFSDRQWSDWPLTPTKFSQWIKAIPKDERFICLGMDYETFGEHKKKDTGIFTFFREFVGEMMRDRRFEFANPSGIIDRTQRCDTASTERAISWADEARDLSAWLGNNLQRDAFGSLYKFYQKVSTDKPLLTVCRYLQTSDHFYYMSTKGGCDGTVHQYFSPFKSPYEAFMNFMNVMADLEFKLTQCTRGRVKALVTPLQNVLASAPA